MGSSVFQFAIARFDCNLITQFEITLQDTHLMTLMENELCEGRVVVHVFDGRRRRQVEERGE
jgi:hypothetical protein